MDLEQARAEFAPTVTYLNTATMGLPPRATTAALDRTLQEWRDGTADGPSFDASLESAIEDAGKDVIEGIKKASTGRK